MADYTPDIRRLDDELRKAGQDFNKELNEGLKKISSFSKSAEDLGKKMSSVVDPTALIDKQLVSSQTRITELTKLSGKYTQTMAQSKDQLYNITSQLEEMQQLQQKENGNRNNLSRFEQERLTHLEKQRDSLERSHEEYQRIYFESMKLRVETEKEILALEKQKDRLTKISAVYQTIMSLADGYDKLLSDTAKAQGTTKDEINKQYEYIQKINTGLNSNLASNQEILAAVTSIRKEYALTGPQLAAIGKETANISRLTGLSVDDATKFQTTLAEVGGTSVMAQEAMTVIAAKAAEAAGVPMGQVMKDVASASGTVRTIFKGNTTELIKQAAEARKLGTSLDAAAKSAESLLNFETSIGSELKLSALLGKNINFNESRRLAFSGDLIAAEKALQKEIEKVGDLDKLNYFQRKALSEATGKDFSELQKIQTQKKNLLEAERMFPEEAEKMRKAQKELESLQKKGLEGRKEELKKLLEQKTAEAELQKLTQAKQEALNNIGKLLKPIYDFIMMIQISFFKFIALITNFESSWAKWSASGVTAITLLTAAFYGLKFGVSKVLDFLGNMFAKAAQSVGEGVGKGLVGISNGLSSLGTAMKGISLSDIAKLTLLLGAVTLAAMGLGYAMSMLGQTSAKQILAFTAALVILGTGLAIIATLMTPPSPLGAGLLIFAGALAVTSLAAIGFAKAIQMVTPSLSIIGNIILGLGTIVAGVINKAFETMLSAFKSLPDVIFGVATPLTKLALLGPLLIIAAAGITALSVSFGMLSITTAALLGILTLGLPVLNSLGKTITTLSNVVGGVIITAFNTMLNVFKLLPTVITSVATGLKTIADIGFLKFARSAAGITVISSAVLKLSKNLVTFPTIQLSSVVEQLTKLNTISVGVTNTITALEKMSSISTGISSVADGIKAFPINQLITITDQLIRLGSVSASINDVINSLSKLSNSAIGIQLAVDSLKELSGLQLPKLDINLKGTESLEKLSESKDKQTEEIKSGLAAVVQKIEILTNMMANGGIAVNLDGQLVSRGLSSTTYKSGGFGQSTTRA